MKHLTTFLFLLIAVTGQSQVVINEVYPTTNQIELKNIGNDVINLTGGRIWDAMQGDLTLGTSVPTECGDFIFAPGEITVFTFNGPLSNAGGQLLLEFASGTPTAYLQWGGSQSLVTFAFSMGLWDDPALFVPAVPSGSSIELIEPENRRNPEGYFLQANPSICDDNITCSITEVTLRDITCENAQTPSDPSDDYFTFVPFVEGVNLNGNIELSIPGIDIFPNTVTPECASCLVGTEPGSATGEDYELTLTANDGECETTVILTAPENCSPVCDIVYHQIINLECNDNDTGASTDDDYLEFLFQAWGFNLSESGYYLIFPNGTEQGPFTYNNAHPISTQGIVPAGSGDFPIIVEDASDATCRKTVTVLDPGSCSDGCLLTTTELSIDCNNNGTPSDQTDDFYELTLEMAGVNVTGLYNANIAPFANEVLSLSYDSLYQFSTTPGSAPDLEVFAFSFLDDEEPCTGLTLNGMFEYDCVITNNLEIVENDKVLISPNPVASTLYFTLADQLLADPGITVELRNMQSTVVYKSPYRDIIDLSTLPAGAYVVTLRSSSWVNRQIIIKS
ncbi:T9SS type A sorting domain-containing protein [Lewinella cohaerens]|uniref:T9SS type A sorting domain-containing protein n=1 Tax=Lewinella cohaerens TaxID=70995 RepID=UPI000379CAFD|nr:T9SS type A sorting domain-containing protein [Lewinella cohaerens]